MPKLSLGGQVQAYVFNSYQTSGWEEANTKYGIVSPSPCLSISEIQELRLEKKRDPAWVGWKECSGG